jgi:DNA-binding LytR/AlgR family response regulator
VFCLEFFAECSHLLSRSVKCRSPVVPYSDRWQGWRREAVICTLAGVFLAITNPYEAAAGFPVWGRFLYWTGLIIIGNLSGTATAGFLQDRSNPPPLPGLLTLVSIAASLTVTAALITTHALSGQEIRAMDTLYLFGLVWVISAAMTLIRHLAFRKPSEPTIAGRGIENPVQAFLARLPMKYRQAELYAVSSEDHYLRVHTSLGQELILLRLSDAIRELTGAAGLQVHRSWWIATPAVCGVSRQAGKTSLVLKDGSQVPVSRTFMSDVRAAGLTH